MTMHRQGTLPPPASLTSALNTSNKRLQGLRLVIARGGWGAIVLIDLLIFAFSIPAYAAQLHIICTTPCQPEQITPGNAVALSHLGIPLNGYIAYMLTITLFTSLVSLATGAIIFWRNSRETIGLLVSLLLITFGCCGSTLELVGALSAAYPHWVVIQIMSRAAFIIYPAFGLFFCLFPNGRFVPRWSWLFLSLWIISVVPFNAPLDSPVSVGNWSPVLLAALLLLTWGNGLFIQIYRYRRISSPEQRQQTKWFAFACIITIVLNTLYAVIGALIPAFTQPDSLYQLASASVTVFFFLSIPLALAIAMLRYRLWDIDLLINRTLVYGLLTVTLLGSYLLFVFGGQYLLASFFGPNNGVILVISTLLVAALFHPLRQRVQQLIDRRFYRSKYDAGQVIAHFSETLRQEVNLEQLCGQLLTTVQETVQPTTLSLWLCPRKPEEDPEQSGTRLPLSTISKPGEHPHLASPNPPMSHDLTNHSGKGQ